MLGGSDGKHLTFRLDNVSLGVFGRRHPRIEVRRVIRASTCDSSHDDVEFSGWG